MYNKRPKLDHSQYLLYNNIINNNNNNNNSGNNNNSYNINSIINNNNNNNISNSNNYCNMNTNNENINRNYNETIFSGRDSHFESNILFENRFEAFTKRMIERQTALSLQNAMDISDVISPNMGISTDTLKAQIVYGSITPSIFLQNVIDFFKGENKSDIVKCNIIMSTMKTKQRKALNIIRKCINNNIGNGILEYEIFKACVYIKDISNVNNGIMFYNQNSYLNHHYHHYNYHLPLINKNMAITVTEEYDDEEKEETEKIDEEQKREETKGEREEEEEEGELKYQQQQQQEQQQQQQQEQQQEQQEQQQQKKGEEEEEESGEGRKEEEEGGVGEGRKKEEKDRGGGGKEEIQEEYLLKKEFNKKNIQEILNDGNKKKELIDIVVSMLMAIIHDDKFNKTNIYQIVKNTIENKKEILFLGQYLITTTNNNNNNNNNNNDNDNINNLNISFWIEPEYNISAHYMENIFVAFENVINQNYTKNENQIRYEEEIEMLKLFFKNLLCSKIAQLVYLYKIYLTFLTSYSLIHNTTHNIKVYIEKFQSSWKCSRGYDIGLLNDTNSSKFKIVEIDLIDTLFILCFLRLTMGNNFDYLFSQVDSYSAAIAFLDGNDTDFPKETISLKIKEIFDSLDSRLCFLKKREMTNMSNHFLDYILEIDQTDKLINPLHCIILDIGDVINAITDKFNNLFIRTTNLINSVQNIIVKNV
uniref:Wsv308-like protein n=1 Tax=Metapenaeus joyneri majanivirus TaxID=2984280 RepID=A0A9C7C6L8_9VIRU|nr:MAG: wsv308-like protein [Metapenaeus joyneri majanivirus]